MIRFLLILLFAPYFNFILPQSIEVVKPNGGETYYSNLAMEVRWASAGVASFILELSNDGGNTWIAPYQLRHSNRHYFVVDYTSSNCLIRVTDEYNPAIFDVSDSTFVLKELPEVDYTMHNYIGINSVLMFVSNNGIGSHDPRSDDSGFYWPIEEDSSLTAVFTDGLLFGGKIDDEIRVGGASYRGGLQPGKILDNGAADDPSKPEYKIWKIRKEWESLPPGPFRDSLEFDYNNWPVDQGAPWVDLNNDGVYTPGIDAPDFIGDEVLFYVSNDLDTFKTWNLYGSLPQGIEIRTTVFGFDRSDILKDAVFKEHKFINKGNQTINDFIFGYFSDCDLGNASDDYMGCDTTLNLGFMYNADNDDDDFYGTPPPAVGYMFLDGIGDGGNKLMNAFGMNFKNNQILPGDPPLGIYSGAIETYNYMLGIHSRDSSHIIDPTTGSATRYPLSGDPFYGTGWYEGDGWPGSHPAPHDRRIYIFSPSSEFAPGDTITSLFSIFMARGDNNLHSVYRLKNTAQNIRDFYTSGFDSSFVTSVELEIKEDIIADEFILYQNYPNPFNPSTKIGFTIPTPLPAGSGKLSKEWGVGEVGVRLKIYDILGNLVLTLLDEPLAPGNYEVDFNAAGLASGIYFYTLSAGEYRAAKKMMVLK